MTILRAMLRWQPPNALIERFCWEKSLDLQSAQQGEMQHVKPYDFMVLVVLEITR